MRIVMNEPERQGRRPETVLSDLFQEAIAALPEEYRTPVALHHPVRRSF
jgi:hypothetical protein